MQLEGELFSSTVLWFIGALYLLVMVQAFRMAPWRRLFNNEQAHVFFGACVCLTLLWSMQIPVQSGLSFHLLGVTTVTLMFGWSLAVIGTSLALIGITLSQTGEWTLFALNAFIVGVIPITLTQVILVVVRSLLPKNFFIFVLGNAFITGGLVAQISNYTALLMLGASGTASLEHLNQTILPFFPMMILPEAILNGWITTIIVAHKPAWISSFDDDLYIKGK
ncbi:energy-coupling factor ABC transporter permease [Pseudomonadota bacterium]